MSYRSKLLSRKKKKEEQELHIFTNPFINSRLQLINSDDYQAPLSARTLSQNSKWIIVRNNLHKIRTWGGINTSNIDPQFRDWYLFFQTKRELRRTQEYIKQVDQRPDFVPVRYFYLPIDQTHTRRYNVSDVQSSDAIYYAGLGHEPIVVQSLLYYFSKECSVPYSSIFRLFLSDICSILYRNRQYINRAVVARKVAAIIAITFCIIIGLMLITLLISVLKTTSEFKKLYANDVDGGIEWQPLSTTVNFS